MAIVSLMFFVVLGIEVVAGRTHSSLQESEIDRQLKLLNKPALKSIQTQYGDIFDCVDINKQPALDHPLLANHKIKVSPRTFGDHLTRFYGYWADQKNQQWWLSLNREPIGYWPMSILLDFQDTAGFVEWGGEVSGPSKLLSPAMGSGYFAKEGEGIAGAFQYLAFVDDGDTKSTYLHPGDAYTQSTNPACYTVTDPVEVYSSFYYGGPGFC
ncbi:hypothetical protein QJS10_CPA09g01700 [Acorus calamus]|uniref:Neprosin PEP catalytic domain-containing protein n=1 Tax=Acorus calamus TaxID=4465 RepID=A0AAV9E5H9_ACOCL|nr:hypothetical protein QJS10_CPA09g01700 [Acorus calamus]